MPSRRVVKLRAAALGQVAFVAVFVVLALEQPALADYAGKSLLEWTARNLIAPLGILALVIALVAAFFRPEFVQRAVYAVIICALLFFVIRSADTLVNLLQAG
jgi:hypothetical protein